jgi:hypothetical protein
MHMFSKGFGALLSRSKVRLGVSVVVASVAIVAIVDIVTFGEMVDSSKSRHDTINNLLLSLINAFLMLRSNPPFPKKLLA